MKEVALNFTRWFLLAVIVLAGWFHYRGMLSAVVAHIRDPTVDRSHAVAALMVSLFTIVWRCREFRKEAGVPSWRGFGWVAFFLVVAWVGAGSGYGCVSQVSLIGLVWSVPYAFWGKGVGRLMSFPAWYLLFTIPVPLDDVTIRLRMLSAGTAVGILNGLDMETGRLGTAIFSQLEDAEFYLDVADPCSGIRSLFAMMSLTAAYAHFMLESRLQRWMLFACSIPIAVAANIFRVLCICLVAHHYGQDAAVGFYHDFSAYVTFLLAILMMFFAKQLVVEIDSWLQKKRLLPKKLSAQDTPTDASPKHLLAVVCLTAALTVLTFVFF